MKYAVVIEKEGGSFGAYVPDLPGCVAVAKTRPRVKRLMAEAIALHLADMRARGEKIPRPSTQVETLDVAVAGVRFRRSRPAPEIPMTKQEGHPGRSLIRIRGLVGGSLIGFWVLELGHSR